MNARRSHPTLDAWLAWLSQDQRDRDLADHLGSCASCGILVDSLVRARSARARGSWRAPNEDVLVRTLGLGMEDPLPSLGSRQQVQWNTAGIRGEGAASVADDATIVAGSCPAGEISVLVRPPLMNAAWSFECRVWLHDAAPTLHAVIALLHEDHVLRRCQARDGETVCFEEVVAEGWTLEFHLPGGDSIVLEDPFAAE